MKYGHLGRSGLLVSRLCLGTMNFGPLSDSSNAHEIMDHAHEMGINFFDTSNNYGNAGSPPGQLGDPRQVHNGWTEEIIGQWFATGGGRRERTVIGTKVYWETGTWPNESKLSALNIRRACEASLRRLHTDYIDLYQMHHIDRDTPWDEIWQAMETLIAQGKILYIGSSNFAGWHIAQASHTAAERGLLGLISEQSLYNLLTRDIELEVIPAAREYGVGILSWSPLHGGLLGGLHRTDRDGRRRLAGRAKSALPPNEDRLAEFEALCSSMGEPPSNVALAWLLHQDGIAAPVIGPRTLKQLDASGRAVDIALDDEVLGDLDRLFPGYKNAPEHYAW